MALTTKRIIALPSQTDPQEGDYLAIDNLQGGTHKIPVGRVGVEVDDTLTEQGKAADAKAVGDALDEIRSQIEVTGTASGAIATFTDGADMPAKSVIVNIEPKQSGTGTPSPDNVRPISGWESVVLARTGVNLFDKSTAIDGKKVASTTGEVQTNPTWAMSDYIPVNSNTNYFTNANGVNQDYTVTLYDADKNYIGHRNVLQSATFNSGDAKFVILSTIKDNVSVNELMLNYPSTDHDYHAYNGQTITKNLGRTVYGGTLDVVSGVLTAYPFYPSYNGETLDGRWICDRAVYAEGTTPPTGSQVALISGTSTTYQLTPTEVNTLLGDNNVWADSGDVEVVYVRDLNIAINNLLNSNGTRSLGMMAMSAPTENTTEEPTEDEAEDDMR